MYIATMPNTQAFHAIVTYQQMVRQRGGRVRGTEDLTLQVGSSQSTGETPAYQVSLGETAPANTNPYALLYDPLGFRVDSQISLNPDKTLEQALQDRDAALYAYMAENGLETPLLHFFEGGARLMLPDSVITPNPSQPAVVVTRMVERIVTWEELGIENEIATQNDGYAYIDHHIFGKLRVDAQSKETLAADTDRIQSMAAAWYEANGVAPDPRAHSYDVEGYQSIRLTVSENNLPSLSEAAFPSTAELSAFFLRRYDEVEALKLADIEVLSAYYSRDEILARAQKAGITAEADLETIVEAQMRYGQTQIDAIRTRGAVNLNEDKADSLARYLRNQTDALTLSVFHDTDVESTAKDVARAALGLSQNVRVGDLQFTYEEYLLLEKRLQDVYDGFRRLFTWREGSQRHPYDVTREQIDTLTSLQGIFGPKTWQILAQWFDESQRLYFEAWESRSNKLIAPGKNYTYDWSGVPRIQI
ncbi:MAG: hypothetical protein LBH86_02405 [Oscillospiraceae bacterium]|jgi:hypothetical protein|nr:hypothetical protein [Oscillospiraceae bacterium]